MRVRGGLSACSTRNDWRRYHLQRLFLDLARIAPAPATTRKATSTTKRLAWSTRRGAAASTRGTSWSALPGLSQRFEIVASSTMGGSGIRWARRLLLRGARYNHDSSRRTAQAADRHSSARSQPVEHQPPIDPSSPPNLSAASSIVRQSLSAPIHLVDPLSDAKSPQVDMVGAVEARVSAAWSRLTSRSTNTAHIDRIQAHRAWPSRSRPHPAVARFTPSGRTPSTSRMAIEEDLLGRTAWSVGTIFGIVPYAHLPCKVDSPTRPRRFSSTAPWTD